MRCRSTTKKNIAPPITCTAPWRVAAVEAEGPLALRVTFIDGLQGTVKFKPSHLKGVFSALKDAAYFKQVFVSYGAVTWPGELDIAPDAMREAIEKYGEWILE